MNSKIQSIPPTQPPAPRIWTSLDLIKWTSEFFKKKGIESARLEAELLLAEVLGVPRIRLYVDFDKAVPQEKLAAYREFVKRRAETREPIQHIIGHAHFIDLKLKVSRAVLIPRPETELLALWAVDCFKPPPVDNPPAEAPLEPVPETLPPEANAAEPPVVPPKESAAPIRVLDLCTGSGCLALYVASKLTHAAVVATDLSAEALAVAAENAGSLALDSRVGFKHGDLFGALAAEEKHSFDLLIANPPYIDPAARATLQPEVRDHEPDNALFADEAGLNLLRRIIEAAPEWLKRGGWMGLEFGIAQAEALTAMATATGAYSEIKIKEDHRRLPRFLLARCKSTAL